MLPRVYRKIFIASLTLALCACSLLAPKFEKPSLSVVSVELQGGNFLQQNFLVKFAVQNPNSRELPVTGLHAELNVLGERVASGVSARPFVVPAQGTSEFEMTISANLAAALLRLGSRANASDSIDYDMTGAATVDLPFVREVPFHQSGSFSLQARRE